MLMCSKCKLRPRHKKHSWCRECQREYSRARYSNAEYKLTKRINQYGITAQQYEEALMSQGGRCAICGRGDSGKPGREWCIDHDHTCCPGSKACGECFRGLLCFDCNIVLGIFRDDPKRFESARRYLNER